MVSRLVISVFVLVLITFGLSQAQRRTSRSRQRPPVTRVGTDYSRFLHSSSKHQQAACNTCHRIPTENWKGTRTFPDVADFPDHEACIGCHRQQFFKGARPAICSVCHSKVSPRDNARFDFRNPARPTQFTIEFPHDRHQDVIALRQQGPWRPTRYGDVVLTSPPQSDANAVRIPKTQADQLTVQPSLFVKAAFPEDRTFNNCAICHIANDSPPAPPTGWIDAYVPDKLTFKTVPSSHASCFNCHWKAEEPISNNCGGCHKPAVSPTPASFAHRTSMKFKHDGGGEKRNHVAECTTCHINITKASSLRGLKPDVPITSCTECHNREGLRQDLSKELEAIDKDRTFVCVYCHTSDVGRRDPPASHYSIVDRPPRGRGN